MNALLPVIVAIILTLANSSNFFAGVMRTAPGEVYLGTTHYYEDYFLYLNQFFQGAHGGWLTANRYTSELPPPSILFWPNVLLGKLGGAVGLSPEISYNLAVLLLSFAVLITISSLMHHAFPKDNTKAFIGFLLAVLSTSLINHIWVNGRAMWYPFQLWKTPNFALDRLGAVPHQIVQTLLFLLAMHAWFFFHPKKIPALLVLLVLLTTLNPVMSALFLFSVWVTYLLTKPRQGSSFITRVAATIGASVTAWYYTMISNQEPHIQSKLWEAGQQITTTPGFMLLSIGPISFVGIIGAWAAVKRARPVHIFSIVLLGTGYLLYFSPIPGLAGISNSRVIFPAMYAAWGILGALGIESLATQLHKHLSSMKISFVTIFLSAIFLLLSLPTLRWEFGQKLLVKPEERIPLLYLPNNVYAAFVYLRNLGSFDDIILANPISHMDTMVPALSGHTGYTGHPFATIGSGTKRAEASRFFRRQMAPDEAVRWLRDRKIRYILLTTFDGDFTRFPQAYPFLKVLFTTKDTAVLESS